jgi:hypothetical protein
MNIPDHEYVKERIAETNRYFEAELRAVREAVDKVEKTNNLKFESQNEWRGESRDRAATYVTKKELWGWIFAIIGVVISIMMYLK